MIHSPPGGDDTDEAQALRAEAQALAGRDDVAGLEQRYELHLALSLAIARPGTTRGQEQAEQALALARQLRDPHREARALHYLGQIYLTEHPEPTRAESRIAQGFHEAALRLREALLGPDHPDVAESLLAIVSQPVRWAPAEPYVELAERAVGICERAFGPEHERTCYALEKLAMALQFAGDFHRMLAVYQRLRAIYAQRYGPESPQVANTISQLAWAHRALGDQVEALAALRELAAMRANAVSADDLSVLHLRLEIGDLLWEQGDHTAAEAELSQLLTELEGNALQDRPETLALLSRIAATLQARGAVVQAASLYERLAASYADDEEQMVPWVEATAALFGLLWRSGEIAGAEARLAQLLAANVPVTLLLAQLRRLGLMGAIQGGEAPPQSAPALIALHERLVAWSEQLRGPGHPDTAATLLALADQLLSYSGDITAALSKLARALAIEPRLLADPCEEALGLIREIDGMLSEEGRYAGVRAIYLQVLSTCELALGTDHPVIDALRWRLGTLPG